MIGTATLGFAPSRVIAQTVEGDRRSVRARAADAAIVGFAATGIDGRVYRLVDDSPRQRIVNLWARWCAPCRRELPSLQRLSARLDAGRFELLTIALDDDVFALREYARDIGLTLPVLPVAQATLPPALRPANLPQTVRLSPDGRVLARVAGAREWDAPGAADLLWRTAALSP